MSPWADIEKGAEEMGRDYVFSRKPSPAIFAAEVWDPEIARMELRKTLETCSRHGCPLEFIMKDISTVNYQPWRLWEWAKIAEEEVEKLLAA